TAGQVERHDPAVALGPDSSLERVEHDLEALLTGRHIQRLLGIPAAEPAGPVDLGGTRLGNLNHPPPRRERLGEWRGSRGLRRGERGGPRGIRASRLYRANVTDSTYRRSRSCSIGEGRQ